jgi:hypothetical protein
VIFLRNVKHDPEPASKFIFRYFDAGFARLGKAAYMAAVILDHRSCLKVLPDRLGGGFRGDGWDVPEDSDLADPGWRTCGCFYDAVHVNPGGALKYSVDESNKIAAEMMKRIPYMDRLVVMGSQDIIDNGTFKTNTSTIMGVLNDEDKRDMVQPDHRHGDRGNRQDQPENKNIDGYAFNQPPIRGLSPSGGVTFTCRPPSQFRFRKSTTIRSSWWSI